MLAAMQSMLAVICLLGLASSVHGCQTDSSFDSKSLDLIGQMSATDKRTKQHCYLGFYEKFFSPLRHTKPKVLEVGIFNGGSILMVRH